VARARSARMTAPSAKVVDMPIEQGFVGMVDREVFDEFLRDRAAAAGATRRAGSFESLTRDTDGVAVIAYKGADNLQHVRARTVIGADGAKSAVGRACVKGADQMPFVFAYHEIVRSPRNAAFDSTRCEIIYNGALSPDFYSWIFPHGDTTSIGSGTAKKGFSIRGAVTRLRAETGLDGVETIRREGAPIPLRPLKRWDNGRDVVLAGDAAGVVAPASGEGIYYAMEGGRLAAEAVDALCETGNPKTLLTARKRFMKAHGRVFFILRIMQHFWYANDKRRERFVSICKDPDVQKLTWDSYMNKKLVRKDPMAHLRIFVKDMGHLLGMVKA
jgi:geranylgeranyl reductase